MSNLTQDHHPSIIHHPKHSSGSVTAIVNVEPERKTSEQKLKVKEDDRTRKCRKALC